MEPNSGSSSAREEASDGASTDLREQASAQEGEERHDEVFEATIIRLDRKAAELLFRLAGL